MGYDTDRFITPVHDDLTCSICRDVLEDPVQAPCEHAFCRSCIEGWMVQETTCPEDRRPISESSLQPLFRYMRNDLNRLRLKCRNYARGCEHICELEFIEAHERDCMFETLKCCYERCTHYAARQDIAMHERTCTHRYQECANGCGFVMTRSTDAHHNCIQELKTNLDVLRSEMMCRYEDQRREFELKTDTQRTELTLTESCIQSKLDTLMIENARLAQDIKFLIDKDMKRRNDIDELKRNNQELTRLLKENLNSQSPSATNSTFRRNHASQATGKVTTI